VKKENAKNDKKIKVHWQKNIPGMRLEPCGGGSSWYGVMVVVVVESIAVVVVVVVVKLVVDVSMCSVQTNFLQVSSKSEIM
jgi:hypothetical protein